MSKKARREYIEAIQERYKKSSKKEKTLILNEFCKVCRVTRKHAIRILNSSKNDVKDNRGAQRIYDEDVAYYLHDIWKLMGEMCSKRLKYAMEFFVPYYPDKKCTKSIKAKLLNVSPATIDRLLEPYRNKKMHGLSTTEQSWLKHKIPLVLRDKDVKEPGHMEADTVSHCGDSAAGTFISTLTMTDLLTGWTVNRAVWGKGGEETKAAIETIENNLPFELFSFASDNGVEFLNYKVLEYLQNRKVYPVEFTRGRPYRKNDQCYVEQKNYTHVRTIFGYDRYDDKSLLKLMNDIYENHWNIFQNYFCPVMKLKSKIRVGGKLKKKYDIPKTPYQRLIQSGQVDKNVEREMNRIFFETNPFKLREEMEKKMKEFFKLVDMRKKWKLEA